VCAFALAIVPGASVRTAAVAAPAIADCPVNPVVTTTTDSGPGSLRQAIADACADETNPLSPVADIVTFAIPGPGPHTIVLTGGPLLIDKRVNILGPSDVSIRISGNHASRVFDVTSDVPFTQILGLTIVDGSAPDGAGIRSSAGTLWLVNSTLTGNVATGSGGGGAIQGTSPTGLVKTDNTTISGNTAADGSAIWTAGAVNLESSTLTANTGGGATVVTGGVSAADNCIITGNGGIAVATTGGGTFTDGGGNLLTGDPKVGPLQDNGGPTFTHMPLPGSPAIDAGNMNTLFGNGDQRGLPRVADGPDGNTVATIDIGAVEVVPAVEFIPAQVAVEGTSTPISHSLSFRLGHLNLTAFDSIVATSSDQAVVANASLAITGSGDSRTLTITIDPGHFGTTAITVAATAQIPNYDTDTTGPVTGTSTFPLTVWLSDVHRLEVADTPSVTDASTPLNRQTTSGLVVTKNAADGAEVTHFRITGISGGTLFQHDGVSPIADGAFITTAEGAAGLRFTPSPGSSAAGHFGVQASIGATIAGLGGAVVTADITVSRAGARTVLTGADAGGGPHVRRFVALDGTPPAAGALNSFFAFDPAFTGGVRVAEGDVNGDGIPDDIAGAGPGAAPEVRVFDGATGAAVSFLAFEREFTGGVFVAAGDVDGDGLADIVVGSGAGRSGQVKVFSGRDHRVLSDTFVFSRAFTGGVSVAAGDVNGDGRADLVVGTGPGVAAEVRVLDAMTGAAVRTFSPYGAFPGGVWVAAGDVTGDGVADLITGAGEGGGPHVQVFDGVTGLATMSFFAFDPSFSGGVRVAAGDVTGDGRADLIVGSGAGRPAAVRLFDGATAALLNETAPYGTFPAGLFVATAVPLNRMVANPPAPGAEISGPFTVAGWGFVDSPSTAGIAAIHVWAVPVDGGVPTFLGLATLGDWRSDVAAFYGAQYDHSGFHLEAPALAPGVYDIALFAQSSLTRTFQIGRVVRVTITP
jgi:FG-GAP-like repeat/FG-GAP repeat